MNHGGCLTAYVVIIIVGIALNGGCFGFFNKHIFGNKQYFDFKQSFNTAYVDIPGKGQIRLNVAKWNDYENSDSIQIVDCNGKVYYTHLNRVVLTHE